MKLKALTIENFRGFVKRTRIDFEPDITAFVGKNDVGKSTIMEALDAFFNGVIDRSDASVSGDNTSVCISCSFTDLPDRIIIDTTRGTDLGAEYLLNEDGCLEVEKVFDCGGAKPKAKEFAVAKHPAGDEFCDLLSLKIDKLKDRAKKLGVQLENVNQTVCSELRHAIWNSCEQNYSQRKIPLDKEDGKKIYDAIVAYLPIFALFKSDRASTDQDAEAQDPMRSVIRETTAQLAEDFEAIKIEIEQRLTAIADATVNKIAEIAPEIAQTLKPNVEAKKLDSLFTVSLAGDKNIPINKRGSGVRRLILLGFFRAESERRLSMDENKSKTVVYAIEEPESSQHPNNQMLILSALKDLSLGDREQVLVTTHNPLLVARLEERSIRYVRYGAALDPEVVCLHDYADRHDLVASLGVLPDHKVKAVLEVEGPNDISFYKNISKNLAALHPDQYVDLQVAEDNGLIIILPMGGSTLLSWVNNLEGIQRPVFNALDRDTKPPATPHYEKAYQEFQKAGHEVFMTSRREIENYIPLTLLKSLQPLYMGTGDDFDDVPTLLSEATKQAYDLAVRNNEPNKPRMMGKDSAKSFLNKTVASMISSDALFVEGDPHEEIRGFMLKISQALKA